MSQTFDIPVDVPWSLVAASPDMMDITFCDEGFPPTWQSSLAIYAYEPSPSDLPLQLCNQRITYLKVTSSITGFQPSKAEVDTLNLIPIPVQPDAPDSEKLPPFPSPSVPADVAEDLIRDYYACYGVLLNVAVFPSTTTVLQDPPVPQEDSFADAADSLPNPFTDGNGLTFSLASGNQLRTALIPAKGPRALVIPRDRLQIDMPLSTNVVLQMAVRNKLAKGTITYQGSAGPVKIKVPAAAPGVQNVRIVASSPITQIVIQQTAEECFLAGLTFDSGECGVTPDDYPHIIDFEPKTRDLYQAATDQGEILTGSNSSVNAGKSLSNTSSSEMGLGLNASVSGDGYDVGGNLTGKWGNTTTDGSTTQIDQSRERRETQGTTTNITQQYNLLTGYHAGTNRAVFLMLPRPHTLQATDYRTFVRGLRMIEGVQEFFLIVSRPTAVPGICIEAVLETGHFPESVHLTPPTITTAPSTTVAFTVGAYAPGHNAVAQYSNNTTGGSPQPPQQTFALPSPWVIDTTKGDLATPGVSYAVDPVAGDTPASSEYQQAKQSKNVSVTTAPGGDAVTISVIINSHGFDPQNLFLSESPAAAQFVFTVYLTQPIPADTEPVVVSPFLVTSRDLCVCINSCPKTNCVMIAPLQQVPYSQSMGTLDGGSGKAAPAKANEPAAGPAAISARLAAAAKTTGMKKPAANTAKNPPPPAGGSAPAKPGKPAASLQSSIVYEAKLKLPRHLLHSAQLQKSRTPAARELMNQIHHHMLASWRLPQRRPHGSVGFADSDYVCERLARHLPKAYLARPIGGMKGLSKGVVQALGAKTTVGDVLKLELHRLRTRAKVSLEDAVRIRRRLLGFLEQQTAGEK